MIHKIISIDDEFLEKIYTESMKELNDFYENTKNNNPKITLNLLIDSIHKNINDLEKYSIKKKVKNIKYKLSYPEGHWWIWKPKNSYIKDICDFIKKG